MKKPAILLIVATVFALNAMASPSIVPPSGVHPRLYVRSSDIDDLKERVESPWGQDIIANIRKRGIDRTPEEEAKETSRGFRYHAQMRGLPSRAQLQALDYLLNGNPDVARTAITGVLDSLKRTHLGSSNDLSCSSGLMVVVGAIVYDWCYDQMSGGEKEAYIKEFIRIAGTMGCGYPPKTNEPVAGHGSEWTLMTDLLSAAIAIYDEYPDMYNYLMNMFDSEYKPPRNYFYQAGNYHQGVLYISVRFSNDMFCQWILNRMSGKDYFDPDQRTVPYDLIYRRRPDGQVLPAGDCNHGRDGEMTFCQLDMLAGSYYHDPYLLHEARKNGDIDPHCLFFKLLWEDTATKDKSPEDLPLTRFSGTPFGWMIARTGWDSNAVIAEMKVNEHFVGNHQHLDGGSFQIYYHGPLAIDSGYYEGKEPDDGYNSPNNKNYTKRTIAHNSLLIYNPDEVFESFNYGGLDKTRTAGNEGGQRLVGKGWDTCRSFKDLLSDEYTVGKTLAHGFGPDPERPEYSLLKGDITQAYSADKVSKVQRSFVFLNMQRKDIPAVMVVFDKIIAKDPSFKKTWLLHSIEEPEIRDGAFIVRRTLDGDTGMLTCNVLWPRKAGISKIGGPGKEMWTGGRNYLGTLRSPDSAHEHGQWRIEESPSSSAAEDIFLNVIQVSDNDIEGVLETERIESSDAVGVLVGDRAVIFEKDGGIFKKEFTFDIPKGKKKAWRILLTDLPEGEWAILCGKKKVFSGKPCEDSGAIYFKSRGGSFKATMR